MNTNRAGWECGVYTQRHMEMLYREIDSLQIETDNQQGLLAALKAQRSEGAVAARKQTEEMHKSELSSLAGELARLSEDERNEVIAMAQAWASGHAYATKAAG